MRQILFAALCFVLGCSPAAPRTFVSKHSPDGKYLAELVEIISGGMGNGDRHFEVRVCCLSTNNSQAETIFMSPDEGAPTERLLWSDDSRYLLVVGNDVCVGPEAVSDKGERIYLLYDLKEREVRCNSNQLNIPMKSFDFRDLAGINFGEVFKHVAGAGNGER
jgi:hypothetical protein